MDGPGYPGPALAPPNGQRDSNPRPAIGSAIAQETIRAVVLAYAEGRIELPHIPEEGKKGSKSIRYAPSFRVGHLFNDHKKMPYNAESIAKFLGWLICGRCRTGHPRPWPIT